MCPRVWRAVRPDEAAGGPRIQVRRALPGEIREEDETLGSGRNGLCLGHQVAVDQAREVPPPPQRPPRRERDGEQAVPARHGVAEGVDPSRRIDRAPVRVGEQHPARADRARHQAAARHRRPDRGRGVVPSARRDRDARRESELGREGIGGSPRSARDSRTPEGATRPAHRGPRAPRPTTCAVAGRGTGSRRRPRHRSRAHPPAGSGRSPSAAARARPARSSPAPRREARAPSAPGTR